MAPSLLTFARFSRIFNRFFLVCVVPSLLAFARSARILNRFLHAQRASYPNLIRHQGLKHFEPGRPAGRPEPIRLGNYRFGAVFFGFATGSFPLRLLSIWCRLFFSEKSYFCIFFTLSAQETRIFLARFLLVTIPNMRAENERKKCCQSTIRVVSWRNIHLLNNRSPS